MTTEELLKRLPEIEARVSGWVDGVDVYTDTALDLVSTLIEQDVPALCAAVRELAAENERLREDIERFQALFSRMMEEENRDRWSWVEGDGRDVAAEAKALCKFVRENKSWMSDVSVSVKARDRAMELLPQLLALLDQSELGGDE